ncbi:MAG TPA: DUF4178 domain-containing protein [Polyangiaceae bacterium]|nr:DUF4178 domain-containing protein [Polyangiaceae bacterium]
MAVAQGNCPNCGAPIAFDVGSSLAKVCEYCRHTVLRSDRGLENLGKVADLAHTPSLVAVGDEGTLGGRPFRVMGRVQLDHGAGPWDEYYLAFDGGQAWGWLAYAQGQWYATSAAAGVAFPNYNELYPELDLTLGPAGFFRVAEVKSATISSTEGELPGLIRPGQQRYYADCYGPGQGFATLDYGDMNAPPTLFLGWVFAEPLLSVQKLGPRSTSKIKMTQLRCPNCGGDVPSLSAERLGCPYCGAISDIAGQRVISVQEAARQRPEIPVGSRGAFDNLPYVCIAYLRRYSLFEDERYSWEEYLLFAESLGFRWLVKDPETGWSFVVPVNLADLDLRGFPDQVVWASRRFDLRNRNVATVEYVLGEVYWKASVGDQSQVMDFASGKDVLSRELSGSEVAWSYSTPVPWPLIAQAFALPVDGPGARFAGGQAPSPRVFLNVILLVVVIALFLCATLVFDDDGGGSSVGGVYRGGGVFSGGK